MRSKVIFGHPKWPPAVILWFFSEKLKLRIDLKWREMWSKVIFGHPKWLWRGHLNCGTNLRKMKVAYWFEMARNAIERHFRSKIAAGGHFVTISQKIKVPHWSGMARNAIESDFRSSKLSAGGHFVEKMSVKLKLCIDLKWREMRSKVIFGHSKWPPADILWQISQKIKVSYWSEMARSAIESDFRSSKMATGGHFVEKNSEK